MRKLTIAIVSGIILQAAPLAAGNVTVDPGDGAPRVTVRGTDVYVDGVKQKQTAANSGEDVTNVVTGQNKSRTVNKDSIEVRNGDVYVDGVKREHGYKPGQDISAGDGAVTVANPDPGREAAREQREAAREKARDERDAAREKARDERDAAKEKAKEERDRANREFKESVKREAQSGEGAGAGKITDIGSGVSNVGKVKVAPGSQTGKITVNGKPVDPKSAQGN